MDTAEEYMELRCVLLLKAFCQNSYLRKDIMKKIGIMQPYFLPYIGYWQLMNLVDQYVLFDDVNYINRGWINRNRILVNGEPTYFNLPLQSASQNKLICELNVCKDQKFIDKTLRMIELAYKKAPYFENIFPMVIKIYNLNAEKIVAYIKNSFDIICSYLEIETKLVLSSSLKKDNSLHGQEKVLAICEELNAREYYNAIGGRNLYFHDEFEKRGIMLKFLETKKIEYHQFGNIFQENLSILDVMMFNSKSKIQGYLNEYRLID